MSAHRLRQGFRKEVDEVFAEARCMAGAGHPDDIQPRRELVERLRKELWTTIQRLQKQARGAAK